MKIEIVDILKNKDGKPVKRITTLDERWYAKIEKSGYKFYPSSTWIANQYPKGIGFQKWYAKHGFDEAELLKIEAGNKGSKVHKATEDIDKGKELKMDDKYTSNITGEKEELSIEGWECLMSYYNFLEERQPKVILSEETVFGEDYAGTLDRIYEIDGEWWLVDLKTSKNVFPSHEIQLSSYLHALPKKFKDKVKGMAILQVGYNRNKKGWKWTEIEDKYELFRHAKGIWDNEITRKEPLQKDYPVTLQYKPKKLKVKTK